uniref:beta-catenin-like protein 1 n=1 Tax=Ciona intestinalis TaxID=7719 RepID=UPI000180CE7A|nr:beta-catenin-like protein 1 [Ciona intestinalis]|eukprot:XP_002130495.1 beta-catenin-like protein 1 [Ciona intestinalis]
MDVGELLAFKPKTGKRDYDDAPTESPKPKISKPALKSDKTMEKELDTFFVNAKLGGGGDRPKKKATRLQLQAGAAVSSGLKRSGGSAPASSAVSPLEENVNDETEEERQMKLLEMWEEKVKAKDLNDEEQYDDQKVKKLILSFEKKVYKNQEMRIKFPDNPEKFMESELDLNDVVMEMKILATMPEQYHYLVELRSVNSLLALINHANTDIAIAVIDLIQELTEVDSVTENEEGANLLADALMDGQAGSLIVQNLERLDESVKEEATGVHNSLGVVENLLELKPEFGLNFAQQGFVAWLLKRLKAKIPFSGNKLYASEILSILLQSHDEIRKLVGELEGIDILLQQLAAFKRHDPKGAEEVEFMENLFNCLCSSLLLVDNRSKFLHGEGLQLMNLMLREKKMSRNSALKVLDHAMSGPDGASNSAKFVDILGLRTLFPIFMKPPKKNKKVGSSRKDHEEHVISIISSMLQNLSGSHRQRLIAKFTENDFAKVDRLMELHFKYYERVQRVDNRLDAERTRLLVEGEDEEEIEEDFYLRRLDAGLFTLQQTDYVLVDICASGSSSIKQRVLQILNLRSGSVKSIRTIIREYVGNLGDNTGSVSGVDKQRILGLADKF